MFTFFGHVLLAAIGMRLLGEFLPHAIVLWLPALWYAVAEAAIEGHHAAGALIEPYLRSRCARIGEALRDIQKAEENSRPERLVVNRGLRSIADILGAA